ncbi:MAG: response regulator, partial [Candidatus Omnitrophota bacterium]
MNMSPIMPWGCQYIFEYTEGRFPESVKELSDWMGRKRDKSLSKSGASGKPLKHSIVKMLQNIWGGNSAFEQMYGFAPVRRTGKAGLRDKRNLARTILRALILQEEGSPRKPKEKEVDDFMDPGKESPFRGKPLPTDETFLAATGMKKQGVIFAGYTYIMTDEEREALAEDGGSREDGVAKLFGLGRLRRTGSKSFRDRRNILRHVYALMYGSPPSEPELDKFDRYDPKRWKEKSPPSVQELGQAATDAIQDYYGGYICFFSDLGCHSLEPFTFPGRFLRALYTCIGKSEPTWDSLYKFAASRDRDGSKLRMADLSIEIKDAAHRSYGGIWSVAKWLGFDAYRDTERSSIMEKAVCHWELYLFMHKRVPTYGEFVKFTSSTPKRAAIRMPTTEELGNAGRDDLIEAINANGGSTAVALELGIYAPSREEEFISGWSYAFYRSFLPLYHVIFYSYRTVRFIRYAYRIFCFIYERPPSGLELMTFIITRDKRDVMPTQIAFQVEGRNDLWEETKERGGWKKAGSLLGLSTPELRSMDLSDWTDYCCELLIFLAESDGASDELIDMSPEDFMKPTWKGVEMPRTMDFQNRGCKDLIDDTQEHGGRFAVAEKLGLALPKGDWDALWNIVSRPKKVHDLSVVAINREGAAERAGGTDHIETGGMDAAMKRHIAILAASAPYYFIAQIREAASAGRWRFLMDMEDGGDIIASSFDACGMPEAITAFDDLLYEYRRILSRERAFEDMATIVGVISYGPDNDGRDRKVDARYTYEGASAILRDMLIHEPDRLRASLRIFMQPTSDSKPSDLIEAFYNDPFGRNLMDGLGLMVKGKPSHPQMSPLSHASQALAPGDSAIIRTTQYHVTNDTETTCFLRGKKLTAMANIDPLGAIDLARDNWEVKEKELSPEEAKKKYLQKTFWHVFSSMNIRGKDGKIVRRRRPWQRAFIVAPGNTKKLEAQLEDAVRRAPPINGDEAIFLIDRYRITPDDVKSFIDTVYSKRPLTVRCATYDNAGLAHMEYDREGTVTIQDDFAGTATLLEAAPFRRFDLASERFDNVGLAVADIAMSNLTPLMGTPYGRLYTSPETENEHLFTGSVIGREEKRKDGSYLVLYALDKNNGYTAAPLYLRPRARRRSKEMAPLPAEFEIEKRLRSSNISVIKSRHYVFGFETSSKLYLPNSAMSDNSVTAQMASYYIEREKYWSSGHNRQTLPQELRGYPYVYVRGCNVAIRRLLAGREKQLARLSADELIGYITAQHAGVPILSDAERALIGHNASLGIKGVELVHGEVDKRFAPALNISLSGTWACSEAFKFIKKEAPADPEELAKWITDDTDKGLPSEKDIASSKSKSLSGKIRAVFGSKPAFMAMYGFKRPKVFGEDALSIFRNFAYVILKSIIFEEEKKAREPTDRELDDFMDPGKKAQNASHTFPEGKSIEEATGFTYTALRHATESHHAKDRMSRLKSEGKTVMDAMCEIFGLSKRETMDTLQYRDRRAAIRAVYSVMHAGEGGNGESPEQDLNAFDAFSPERWIDRKPPTRKELGEELYWGLNKHHGGYNTFFAGLGCVDLEPQTFPGAFLRSFYTDVNKSKPNHAELTRLAMAKGDGTSMLRPKDLPLSAESARIYYGGVAGVAQWRGFGARIKNVESALHKDSVYTWELFIFIHNRLPTYPEHKLFKKRTPKDDVMPTLDQMRESGRDDLAEETERRGGSAAVAQAFGLKLEVVHAAVDMLAATSTAGDVPNYVSTGSAGTSTSNEGASEEDNNGPNMDDEELSRFIYEWDEYSAGLPRVDWNSIGHPPEQLKELMRRILFLMPLSYELTHCRESGEFTLGAITGSLRRCGVDIGDDLTVRNILSSVPFAELLRLKGVEMQEISPDFGRFRLSVIEDYGAALPAKTRRPPGLSLKRREALLAMAVSNGEFKAAAGRLGFPARTFSQILNRASERATALHRSDMVQALKRMRPDRKDRLKFTEKMLEVMNTVIAEGSARKAADKLGLDIEEALGVLEDAIGMTAILGHGDFSRVLKESGRDVKRELLSKPSFVRVRGRGKQPTKLTEIMWRAMDAVISEGSVVKAADKLEVGAVHVQRALKRAVAWAESLGLYDLIEALRVEEDSGPASSSTSSEGIEAKYVELLYDMKKSFMPVPREPNLKGKNRTWFIDLRREFLDMKGPEKDITLRPVRELNNNIAGHDDYALKEMDHGNIRVPWGFVVIAESEDAQALHATGLSSCSGLALKGRRNGKDVFVMGHFRQDELDSLSKLVLQLRFKEGIEGISGVISSDSARKARLDSMVSDLNKNDGIDISVKEDRVTDKQMSTHMVMNRHGVVELTYEHSAMDRAKSNRFKPVKISCTQFDNIESSWDLLEMLDVRPDDMDYRYHDMLIRRLSTRLTRKVNQGWLRASTSTSSANEEGEAESEKPEPQQVDAEEVANPVTVTGLDTASDDNAAVGEPVRKKTILVAEDDKPLAGTLRDILEASGYRVIVTDSAADACSFVDPNLAMVVTDLGLKGGERAGEAVIAAAKDAGIPVLLITGNSDVINSQPEQARLRQLGADRIILKPARVPDIRAAVKTLASSKDADNNPQSSTSTSLDASGQDGAEAEMTEAERVRDELERFIKAWGNGGRVVYHIPKNTRVPQIADWLKLDEQTFDFLKQWEDLDHDDFQKAVLAQESLPVELKEDALPQDLLKEIPGPPLEHVYYEFAKNARDAVISSFDLDINRSGPGSEYAGEVKMAFDLDEEFFTMRFIDNGMGKLSATTEQKNANRAVYGSRNGVGLFIVNTLANALKPTPGVLSRKIRENLDDEELTVVEVRIPLRCLRLREEAANALDSGAATEKAHSSTSTSQQGASGEDIPYYDLAGVQIRILSGGAIIQEGDGNPRRILLGAVRSDMSIQGTGIMVGILPNRKFVFGYVRKGRLVPVSQRIAGMIPPILGRMVKADHWVQSLWSKAEASKLPFGIDRKLSSLDNQFLSTGAVSLDHNTLPENEIPMQPMTIDEYGLAKIGDGPESAGSAGTSTAQDIQSTLTHDASLLLDLEKHGLTKEFAKDMIYNIRVNSDWADEHKEQYQMLELWIQKLSSLYPESTFYLIANGDPSNGLIDIESCLKPEYDPNMG